MSALPSVGDDFGDYHVTGVVGRGTMGVVYEAVQRRLSRTIALKVLASDLVDAQAHRERFVREAETLSRLDSPHIVQIYDYGEIGGSLFIATQLVRGGDLGQWLRRRWPLEVGSALDVMDQVASALADAHAAGVIHRDLKPANVLVREGPYPFAYLCDFGSARQSGGRLTTAGPAIDTCAYLSPEQCNGLETTPRSDIYSLGCLLWTTLTGDPPYRGTDLQVAMQHTNGPVPRLSLPGEVGHRLNQVLQASMAKRPGDRYQQVDEFSAALREAAKVERIDIRQQASGPPGPPRRVEATVLRGAVATPRPPMAAPSKPRTRRGLAALSVLLGVLVLASIVGVGAYLVFNGSESGAASDADIVERQAVLTRVSYDGNRLSDVAVQPNEAAGDLAVFHSAGKSFAAPALTPQSGNVVHRINGDFDGDHRTDEAIFRPEGDGQSISVRLSQPSSGFGPPEMWGRVAGMGEDDGYPVSGDFDGNGRGDIAWVHVLAQDSMEVLVKLSNGKGFGPARLWEPAQPWSKEFMPALNPGDVNADGRTDLVAFPGDGSGVSVKVLLSQRDHFADPDSWRTLENTNAGKIKAMVGDFDGGGAADVLILEPFTTPEAPGLRAVLLHSTETAFSEAVPRFTNDTWVLNRSWVSPGDFDGDGLYDFARIAPSEDRGIDVWVALSQSEGFDTPRVWGSWADMMFDDVRTLNRVG